MESSSAILRSGPPRNVKFVAPVSNPSLRPAATLLDAIVDLSKKLPQNRNAACRLSDRCQYLYNTLNKYEKKHFFDHTGRFQATVSKCLNQVKDAMQKWSEKNWVEMLVHQGDFEAEFNDCDSAIADCLTIFYTVSQMDASVSWKENAKWTRDLRESLNADHKAIMEQFAAIDFTQRVTESELWQDQDDIRAILMMMQKGLAEHNVVSEEGRNRMAKNLYNLLRLSNLLPPECQLHSGMVGWSGEIPVEGGRNVDTYKGRYLQCEDVRIKVMRTVNMTHEKTVERIRREVEVWGRIYAIDKGMHITPFYGFYSPDGFRLALVSPWVNNGNTLAYVKKNDNVVNYKRLIIGTAEGIKVLHSMNPPIIHGNLRAENILIGDEGQPLITDFALAKLEGNEATRSGGESDSYRWFAPEMFEDYAKMSAKGDIYSFGMTILELLTHDVPYANIKRNFQVLLRKGDGILPNRPHDKQVIKRGLDNMMWHLLSICWSRDPMDRPSIAQLVAVLSEDHASIHGSIESLFVAESEMYRSKSLNKTETNNDIQLNQNKLLTFTCVPLLLAALSELKALGKSPVNDITLRHARELLDLPDFSAIQVPSETWSSSNIKLLLDFILSLFHEDRLINSGIQDSTQKARQLMLKLTLTDVMPESLFITGVNMDSKPFAVGGYGRIFRGDYKGKQVALKMVDKGRKEGSLRQDFCREALVWRSLSHRFILPLLGIFEDGSQLYLVSPFMRNKTLRQWRDKHSPAVVDIHKMMLEVAKGVQYVHAEGIVHGDLHGGNVLLDSDLSCKITDFGSSRHFETVASRSTRALTINFAAPELFGLCINCGQSQCNGCYEGDEKGHRGKTMETDVYAFGCLYYEIFFNTVPFHKSSEHQIIRLITNGERPSQLQSPEMGDNTWNLIQSCWEPVPSKRPRMNEIVELLPTLPA